MSADFWLKRSDLAPSITATLVDADGVALDIQGVDVTFAMRYLQPSGAWDVEGTVYAAATNLQSGDGSDGSKGQVRYDWVTGDTDIPGGYKAEWSVDFAGDKPGSFPNNGYTWIAIIDDLSGGS